MERLLIVDGRNMLESRQVTGYGFHYVSVGRGPVLPPEQEQSADKVLSSSQTSTNVAVIGLSQRWSSVASPE